MTPSQYLKKGNEFPFDAPDSWWGQPTRGQTPPPAAADHVHFIARGVAKALETYSGACFNLGRNEASRAEIVQEISAIIKEGLRTPVEQTRPMSEADMAEQIYGKGVENALANLRTSLYRELGNLLKAQAKGAVIPPDITVSNVKIPLIPSP